MARTAEAAYAVTIDADNARLSGDLVVPDGAQGIVLFAHGSGSGRHSPRNRFVAETLRQRGLATLLMDLLTEVEEQADLSSGSYRFDINLLARRLTAAVDWVTAEPATSRLRIGAFGASTGAAAALMAAAERPDHVKAVVSRGGRPDLAGDFLSEVVAPTLLIVGGNDHVVIDLNERAHRQLQGIKRIEIVPRATHLFEEPGALARVSELAADWFGTYLR